MWSLGKNMAAAAVVVVKKSENPSIQTPYTILMSARPVLSPSRPAVMRFLVFPRPNITISRSHFQFGLG
jgi:hypothetical protein